MSRKTQDNKSTPTDRVPSLFLSRALLLAAGISFFLLCMSMPLVGPAGSRVPNAAQNRAAFLSVLAVTFLLSVLSAVTALRARKAHPELPFPRLATGLAVLCIVILVLLLAGWFAV